MANLRRLELDKFEPREYAALNWVHHFLTCPAGVPMEVEEVYVSTFTPQERACVMASMKSMFCVNLLVSTAMQGRLGSKLVGMIAGAQGPGRELRLADFPEAVLYHREHMWARSDGTIGISGYAQEQLGDIVFLEVDKVGKEVKAGEPIGVVESSKAVSDLHAPVGGMVMEANAEALQAPELVNHDPYGAGWIARMDVTGPGELDCLLCAGDYWNLIRG